MIPIYVKDMIYEPFARKYIDLVAAISNYENIWRCKTIHIDNAINLNEIKLKKKRKADGVIKLISVSNEQIYHGYPKLVKGLYSYYNNGGKRKIKIYFVGEFRKQTKKLVDKLGMTENIYFLGKKYDEELESIYDCVDLGIGALGLHSGSEYGSSIKTKEYFAKGIPFINGWKEYAFDDNYPYVKRFNVYSEMIDFNQVVDFYDNIKDDENLQLKMREFAEKNYTWEIMMKRVFDNV
jgi:glycosyltransferase involved in cell wall biosynthesis